MTPYFSVIIPVYREEEVIQAQLDHLFSLPYPEKIEVIIVDGHPYGTTLSVLSKGSCPFPVKTIVSQKGRGVQLHTGAFHADGSVLVFLHADTVLPKQAFYRIHSLLEDDEQIVGGAFDLAIAASGIAFRVIEQAASLRSRLTRVPYGDQAIFIRKQHYRIIGGFSPIPIMEDVNLMRRIKKRKWLICILPDRVRTSPRRWEREGVLQCILRNWLLMLLYSCHVPPDVLARFYRNK